LKLVGREPKEQGEAKAAREDSGSEIERPREREKEVEREFVNR